MRDGGAATPADGVPPSGPSISQMLSGAGRRPLDAAKVTGELPAAPVPPQVGQPEAPRPVDAPPAAPAESATETIENPVLAAQLASVATGTDATGERGLPDDVRGDTTDEVRAAARAALEELTRSAAMRTEAPREGERPVRRGLAGDLRALAFFSAAVNVLLLAMPLHMLAVYERVLASGSGATLLYITLLALGALVLLGIAEIVRSMVAQRMAAAYVARTAEPLFRGLMSDEVLEREGATRPDGEVVSRGSLLRSFYALRSVLSSRAILGVLDLPFTLLFLVLLFVLNVQIGFITLFGIALLGGLAWLERRMSAETSADATRANSEAVSFSQAFVGKAQDVRAMGLFPYVLRHWGEAMGRAITHADDASRVNATFFGISRTIRQALQVVIIAWGAWLVLAGDMSGGMIFAASLISGRAIAPVEQVIGAWDRLTQGWRSYQEIETFLADGHETESAVVPSVTAGDLAVEKLGVEIVAGHRVVPVLRDVSFELSAGTCMAIVGPSGAGKSTLARCLSGATMPTTGSVRLDDFELSRWPDRRRRQSIGYVPQDATLFPGTIAENISGFAPTPDDDAIVAAARAADIHAQIVRLPEGYSTVVGQSGQELSGGQRAQVALARAFYAGPRVLVLDEPNAHLDQRAEEGFLRTVARLKSEGTAVIIVSQRRSVLKVADIVLTLNEGRVHSLADNRGQWRARRTDAREPDKDEVRVDELPSTRPGVMRGAEAPRPGGAA